MSMYDMWTPTVSAKWVAGQWRQRKVANGVDQIRMQRVQRLVNGDVVVALPEINKAEKSSVPNRAREGLKQFSQRIASVLPELDCPVTRPGFDVAEKRANERRRAILGWWSYSKLNLALRQRARYLQAYAASPVEICWDVDEGVPLYKAINPLFAYPSHMNGIDMCPHDLITECEWDFGWIQDNYPTAAGILWKGPKCDRDTLFTVLTYWDCEQKMQIAIGAKPTSYGPQPDPESMQVVLDAIPNRINRCPIVYPKMICLDRLQGQYDGIDGMYETEAILTAMAIQATKKGVFADTWLVQRNGEEAEIVRDPRPEEGQTGLVKGADLTFHGVDPQFQTNLMIDRLTAAQNETSGLTSELQGQAGSNIRTGARASVLLSNVIDFPIQEGQEVLSSSLENENKIAIAFAKTYGGRKSFYVEWEGEKGPVTYDPKTTFETDQNLVRYPLAGADGAGMVIQFGQRLGMGTMSRMTFMKHDPAVPDAEVEHDRIVGEKLEDAVVNAIQMQSAQGAMDMSNVLRIAELVTQNQQGVIQAAITARDEAQQKQAQQAPPTAPEAQPGLGAAPTPQIAPQADEQGLAGLLASLRRPQNATPQEMAAG